MIKSKAIEEELGLSKYTKPTTMTLMKHSHNVLTPAAQGNLHGAKKEKKKRSKVEK